MPDEYASLSPEELERILRELAGGFSPESNVDVLPIPIDPSGEMFKDLLEQIPAITFWTSFLPSKQNVYVSPQIEKILGYTPAEWLSKPSLWQERLHPDDKDRFQKEFSETVMSRGTAVQSVYRFKHRDGRTVWIQGDVRIKRDKKTGNALYVQAVGVDVTKLEEAKQKELAEKQKRIDQLQSEVHREFGPDALVGSSKAMEDLRKVIRKVARSDASSLITGESGTGKELVARALHNSGRRKEKPFVAVNCGAFPDATLLDDALFGHKKGAFTDAKEDYVGRLEEANGGTLFLDEIGNMPALVQEKILRFIQERTLRPLGAKKDVEVDVRIIAATHKDLPSLIEQETFKVDLYYKLKVVEIKVPPLRERSSDIPELAAFFLARANRKEGKEVKLPDEAIQLMKSYPWSENNVRELEHAIEGAVVLCEGDTITPNDLPSAMLPQRRPPLPGSSMLGSLIERVLEGQVTLNDAIERMERSAIEAALGKSDWKKTDAANALGIPPRVLEYKMAKYGIKKPQP